MALDIPTGLQEATRLKSGSVSIIKMTKRGRIARVQNTNRHMFSVDAYKKTYVFSLEALHFYGKTIFYEKAVFLKEHMFWYEK